LNNFFPFLILVDLLALPMVGPKRELGTHFPGCGGKIDTIALDEEEQQ
jgi:hypothetical protein